MHCSLCPGSRLYRTALYVTMTGYLSIYYMAALHERVCRQVSAGSLSAGGVQRGHMKGRWIEPRARHGLLLYTKNYDPRPSLHLVRDRPTVPILSSGFSAKKLMCR